MGIFQQSERRQYDRWLDHSGCVVAVNGRIARLKDFSARGAKVEYASTIAPGTAVVLDLPWGKKVRGSVVANGLDELRLKFDYEIERPI